MRILLYAIIWIGAMLVGAQAAQNVRAGRTLDAAFADLIGADTTPETLSWFAS